MMDLAKYKEAIKKIEEIVIDEGKVVSI